MVSRRIEDHVDVFQDNCMTTNSAKKDEWKFLKEASSYALTFFEKENDHSVQIYVFTKN